MTDYCIITDSTSDLTPELVEYLGIDVLPMDFIMDEITYHHYPDSHELNERIFYQSLRDGKTSKTMQISMGMFIEYFEKYLKENKDVLYISFSSALSGTYSSACSAVKELEKVYKDNKVIVVDSKCASMGMGQPNLNTDIIGRTKIVFPTLVEQQKVVSYLEDRCGKLNSLITEKESLINDLEAYKKSLIYEVVTGKRRVV